MDDRGKNVLGKGAFDSSGKEKRYAFTSSAMKMGIPPPLCILHFPHCLLKTFKKQIGQFVFTTVEL